jgi:hypothetical protein
MMIQKFHFEGVTMRTHLHDATKDLVEYQLVDELVHRTMFDADGGKDAVCRMLAYAWLEKLKDSPGDIEGIGDWLKGKFDGAVDDVVDLLLHSVQFNRDETAPEPFDPADEIPF